MGFLEDNYGIANPTFPTSPNAGNPGFSTGAPAAANMSGMIDQFQQQNLSPSDIANFSGSIPQTLGGIPGIGSRIPGLGSVPIPILSKLPSLLSLPNTLRFGMSGSWESTHYADDLNAHHPKFKFLFKVTFAGFIGGQTFYRYVHRCDRPKVKFQHQDVNYYNFRTRVLTHVTYEPMSITFLDEIGNSVNQFFVSYLQQRSGTGRGNYGIEQGFGAASSSMPYAKGYTQQSGQRIIVEQIFANGTMTNRFVFINPRIESFDFDELSMDDSNNGSMATISFSYDALQCYTVYGSVEYTWGNVDLFRGGGTSGAPNAGQTSLNDGGGMPFTSVDGRNINGSPRSQTPGDVIFDALGQGMNMLSSIPSALGGAITNGLPTIGRAFGNAISSAGDVISQGIQGTIGAIQSGANLAFGSSGGQPTVDTIPPASAAQNDAPPASTGWENSKSFGSSGILTAPHADTGVTPAQYFGADVP